MECFDWLMCRLYGVLSLSLDAKRSRAKKETRFLTAMRAVNILQEVLLSIIQYINSYTYVWNAYELFSLFR